MSTQIICFLANTLNLTRVLKGARHPQMKARTFSVKAVIIEYW